MQKEGDREKINEETLIGYSFMNICWSRKGPVIVRKLLSGRVFSGSH